VKKNYYAPSLVKKPKKVKIPRSVFLMVVLGLSWMSKSSHVNAAMNSPQA
jgi:hypothetical protein